MKQAEQLHEKLVGKELVQVGIIFSIRQLQQQHTICPEKGITIQYKPLTFYTTYIIMVMEKE